MTIQLIINVSVNLISCSSFPAKFISTSQSHKPPSPSSLLYSPVSWIFWMLIQCWRPGYAGSLVASANCILWCIILQPLQRFGSTRSVALSRLLYRLLISYWPSKPKLHPCGYPGTSYFWAASMRHWRKRGWDQQT